MADFNIEAIEKPWRDKGKHVEAGWAGLSLLAYRGNDPRVLEELRNAFFAGAHHMMTELLSASVRDQKIVVMDNELNEFMAVYTARHIPEA